MAALVEWFTTAARTYEIERYDATLDTWSSITTGLAAASVPYTDATGTTSLYYRVRDDTDGVGNESPWTPQFLGLKSTPETCTVYGYIYSPAGEPTSGSYAEFRVLRDQVVGGSHYSMLEPTYAATDSDGLWEQELVQGLTVFVKIPDNDIQDTIIVPATSTASIDTLL